jgi:hypothetical protein
MGLFSFLKKKDQAPADTANPADVPVNGDHNSLLPEPGFHNNGASIDTVYAFLQFDYESRGYNDALTNPDDSYRNDNVNLLKQDLFILFDKSLTYYEGLQKEVDFHITSRERAGLIDLVEELKIRKEMVNDHLSKVRIMREEALNGNGPVQRITLSYQRGFMRGLSAITHTHILQKKL